MDFFNIFRNAHKGFAYLELLLVAIFLILLFVTLFRRTISKTFRKVTMFTMIFFHIQFLVGVVLLFVFSPGFKAALDSGNLMKDEYSRQTFVEHPFSMLVAAILMTIINRKLKTTDKISVPLVCLSLVAVALFAFAFPWAKVFGA